ncbi:MAG: L,D-transpeptidase family protein, partial [Bacteroidota bacterium]
ITLLMVVDAAAQAEPTQAAIKKRIEQVRRDGRLEVESDQISAIKLIPDYYEAHKFRPAWTDPSNVEDLFRAIDDLEKDGLLPKDYHRDALLRLKGRIETVTVPDPELVADYDLLLMDAMIRMVYHMLVGKVDPERLDPNWNLSQDIQAVDPVAGIRDALTSGALYQFLERTKPTAPYYVRLKKALADYRAIQEAGGWEAVPEGQTLKPGMTDRRIPAIRERLAVTGDLPKAENRTSEIFDTQLEEAVKQFQRRHRIADDGVIGKGTLAEMNVPVAARIDQIRVNLERGRWVLQDIDREYVLVNIAGFHAAHVRDGAFDFLARVQVGKPYRKTPVFKAELKYIVFNPTWTVPPTILAKDVLPAIKKDPSYLNRKNMDVVTHSGKVLDPSTIDWSRYSGSDFPYMIRQGPGPTNALGLVKFIFPNQYFVFLHDTPSKSLFDRETRTFSSGCIRVENPFELAERLLDDPEKWNRAEIDKVIRSEKTQTVYLNRPMPVVILYWTAYVDEVGQVHFMGDVYERDNHILEDLDEGFRVRERDRRGR